MPSSPRVFAVSALLVLAGTQAAYGLVAGPVFGSMLAADPGRVFVVGLLRALAIGGIVTLGAWALAVVAFAAAVGVASGNPWGWRAGLVSTVLWLPSGCLPVSLLVLAALLHPDVRPPVVLRLPADEPPPDPFA